MAFMALCICRVQGRPSTFPAACRVVWAFEGSPWLLSKKACETPRGSGVQTSICPSIIADLICSALKVVRRSWRCTAGRWCWRWRAWTQAAERRCAEAFAADARPGAGSRGHHEGQRGEGAWAGPETVRAWWSCWWVPAKIDIVLNLYNS